MRRREVTDGHCLPVAQPKAVHDGPRRSTTFHVGSWGCGFSGFELRSRRAFYVTPVDLCVISVIWVIWVILYISFFCFFCFVSFVFFVLFVANFEGKKYIYLCTSIYMHAFTGQEALSVSGAKRRKRLSKVDERGQWWRSTGGYQCNNQLCDRERNAHYRALPGSVRSHTGAGVDVNKRSCTITANTVVLLSVVFVVLLVLVVAFLVLSVGVFKCNNTARILFVVVSMHYYSSTRHGCILLLVLPFIVVWTALFVGMYVFATFLVVWIVIFALVCILYYFFSSIDSSLPFTDTLPALILLLTQTLAPAQAQSNSRHNPIPNYS